MNKKEAPKPINVPLTVRKSAHMLLKEYKAFPPRFRKKRATLHISNANPISMRDRIGNSL